MVGAVGLGGGVAFGMNLASVWRHRSCTCKNRAKLIQFISLEWHGTCLQMKWIKWHGSCICKNRAKVRLICKLVWHGSCITKWHGFACKNRAKREHICKLVWHGYCITKMPHYEAFSLCLIMRHFLFVSLNRNFFSYASIIPKCMKIFRHDSCILWQICRIRAKPFWYNGLQDQCQSDFEDFRSLGWLCLSVVPFDLPFPLVSIKINKRF